MCICAIAWQLFEDKPLILLANRDEFFDRPTLPLHLWETIEQTSEKNCPILAGQDLTAGGTWLGLNPHNHRWAVILNFREIVKDKPTFSTSRGQIIRDFLQSGLSPYAFAKALKLTDFDGFNLIIGNREQAVMLNNKGVAPTILPTGLYGVSNGQPEGFEKSDFGESENWFKTERLRLKVRQEILPLIATGQDFLNQSFDVLADTLQAPHERLPNTGLSLEAELALSSIFIPPDRLGNLLGRYYGTRCSNVLWLTQTGFEFYEKTVKENSESFLTVHVAPPNF